MDFSKEDLLLKNKNVLLKPISINDIEQIRIWRNSKEINKYFIFRGKISKSDQIKWFRKISNSNNDFYFSIFYDKKLIGLTEIKKINWSKMTGNAGIFIIPEYQNGLISFKTSLLLYDFSYNKLNLSKIEIEVLEDNKRALKYNKFFGYEEYGKKTVEINNNKKTVLLLKLDRGKYLRKKSKLSNILNP